MDIPTFEVIIIILFYFIFKLVSKFLFIALILKSIEQAKNKMIGGLKKDDRM
jgi:hypothetical protein